MNSLLKALLAPSPSNGTVAVTHPSCAASADGALQLAMQPGGAYTVAWSNGEAGESIGGLAAGSYTATITDASGCSAEKTMVLLAPAPMEVLRVFS
ncbi:MAG: hypothetical protein H6558_23105 [Lewinellaceae bacterium]|nr:hypothetical protein [Lewinellaceae bacterium]